MMERIDGGRSLRQHAVIVLCGVLASCTAPAADPLLLGGEQTNLKSHQDCGAACSNTESSDGSVASENAAQCQSICDIVAGKPREIEAPPAGGRVAEGELWGGYIQGGPVNGGSDQIRFWLSSVDSDGAITGVVRFGDADLIDQPTSPADDFLRNDYTVPITPMEGYNYEIEGGSLSNGRLVFHITPSEVMTGYCALQTPYLDCASVLDPNAEESWSCVPYSYGPMMGQAGGTGTCEQSRIGACMPLEVGCSQASFCLFPTYICNCAADGCRPDLSFGQVDYDLRVDGSGIQGVMSGEEQRQIFLTRM